MNADEKLNGRTRVLYSQAEAAHLAGHALGLPAGTDVTTALVPAIHALTTQLADATQQREVMAELLAQASTQLQIVFERDATYWDFHGLVPRIDAALAQRTTQLAPDSFDKLTELLREPTRIVPAFAGLSTEDDIVERIDAALAGKVPGTAEIAEWLPPDCTDVTRTAPKRIWLSVSDDPGYHNEPFPEHPYEIVGWLDSDMGGTRVEYVRADIVAYGDTPT